MEPTFELPEAEEAFVFSDDDAGLDALREAVNDALNQ